MPIKVGIDALFIRPGGIGGTESYLRNLLKGLERVDKENEYYIFASKTNYDTFRFVNKHFKVIICDVDNRNKLHRIIYTSTKLPKLIKNYKISVMFFPTYVRCISNIRRTKIVSNVHDIQYMHFPKNFNLSKRILFKLVYPLSLKKSDKNICISNFVKQDIMSHFNSINKDNFEVIYNPIDFEKFNIKSDIFFENVSSRYGIETKNYMLSVASLLPHKNISTLIRAFSIYKSKNKNHIKLVLVGLKESSSNELLNLISKLNIERDVIITGFVSDDELNLLYNNASIFICTSLFEGFGMPPIEAMYRNIPVLTTRCASLPEVTMGETIYYDNPTDENELARAVENTLNSNVCYSDDIRQRLVEKYSLENIALKYKLMFEGIMNKKTEIK